MITDLSYGGAETQLVRLAIRFAERGWKVRVMTLTQPQAYVETLENAGIPVASLGIRRKSIDPGSVLRLARWVRAWQPEILHSLMAHANLLTRIARPFMPGPALLCSARNTNEGGRLREVLYRITDPLCDLTTQVSRAGLDRYVRVGAVPRRKIAYVPNGVDTDVFGPNDEVRKRLRGEMGLEERFAWLAVGRLVPQKRYADILEAFGQIVRDMRQTVLYVVGEGPLRAELREIVAERGLTGHVRFLGIRSDVPALMNAADAYVMASLWEGMANVLLEAGATGLPIVATDVGGNRDVVIDGRSGFLVPSGDVAALARAMTKVMTLPETERLAMGQVGRRHIIGNFRLDRVVDQWEDLYGELLDRRSQR